MVYNIRCVISGCSPDIALHVRALIEGEGDSVVAHALEDLVDTNEHSLDDLSVIGPIHPSGQPYAVSMEDGFSLSDIGDDYYDPFVGGGPSKEELSPETDIHVMPHCVMGYAWEDGYVDAAPGNKPNWMYCVWYGTCIVVQTFALDIMVLATHGRMTPLRVWNLAMDQDFEESDCRPGCFEEVHYGAMASYKEGDPEVFPGLSKRGWNELREIKDAEVVKHRLVHKGKFWMWMAPDRFPVSPTDNDPQAPILPEVQLSKNYSAFEKVPLDILVSITSTLPLESIVNLASTSRLLRTNILGNEYLARTWISTSAPWWIPVPTRTPRIQDDSDEDESSIIPILPYLASGSSQWDQDVQDGHSAGLDWAYVRRCARSGSMRNRRRIWITALDIERLADQSGV